MADKKTNQVIATNRTAGRDYELFESVEAGIQLQGTEVKSLRQGKCQLKDCFARFDRKGELHMYNAHIAPYEQGNIHNHDPLRPRKLLLHKRELLRLFGRLTTKGLTLIVRKIYLKHGLFKAELALGKAKKHFDRREDIKKRIVTREIDRAIKSRRQ